MKIHTLLKNITLALSLTSAVVTPTVYATDVTEAAQPLSQKSYGTFIAGIAQNTTLGLADLSTSNDIAVAKLALENAFSNMAYATIYGIEKDASGHIIGRFNKDTSGKSTSIEDVRVRNILNVCENLATYLYRFEPATNAVSIADRIYNIIGKPRSAADAYTEETDFSYLQRLMLMRITHAYFKKLDENLNDVASLTALKNKMIQDMSAPKLPDASKNIDFYWDKTNAAIPVIHAEINKTFEITQAIIANASSPHVKSPEAYLRLANECFRNFKTLRDYTNLAKDNAWIAKIDAAFKKTFADGLVGYLYMIAGDYKIALNLFGYDGTIISQSAQKDLNRAAYNGEIGFTTVTGRDYLEWRTTTAGDQHAQSRLNSAAEQAKLGFTEKTGAAYLKHRINAGDESALLYYTESYRDFPEKHKEFRARTDQDLKEKEEKKKVKLRYKDPAARLYLEQLAKAGNEYVQDKLYEAAYFSDTYHYSWDFTPVIGRAYLEDHAKSDEKAQSYLNNAAHNRRLGFNDLTGKAYLEERAAKGDKDAQKNLKAPWFFYFYNAVMGFEK